LLQLHSWFTLHRVINGWYQSQGYVMSTVAQAQLFGNGAVVLQVTLLNSVFPKTV
jgi:hypothetical protein